MAIRNIIKKGDEGLNKTCRKVTEFNPRLHKLLDDMKETLIEYNGVGLAAPQVGVLRRAVVVIDTNTEDNKIIELVNPEIVERDGEQEGPEGCLSIPGVWGIVKRPMHVKVKAQDRFGSEFEVEGDGLTARAYCHEIDHLSGILFDSLAEHILTPDEMQELSREDKED